MNWQQIYAAAASDGVNSAYGFYRWLEKNYQTPKAIEDEKENEKEAETDQGTDRGAEAVQP